MAEQSTSQPEVASDVAARAVEALRAGLGDRLVAVVLFGSRARGDAREESDWDLLVIANDLPPGVLERQFVLSHALPPGIRGAVSVLAKTPEEFEENVPSLYLDIALDGKILYDPTGYARKHLDALRTVIEQAGLRRRRTQAGDIWYWERQPPDRWDLLFESTELQGHASAKRSGI